jgi:hypothetical protein
MLYIRTLALLDLRTPHLTACNITNAVSPGVGEVPLLPRCLQCGRRIAFAQTLLGTAPEGRWCMPSTLLIQIIKAGMITSVSTKSIQILSGCQQTLTSQGPHGDHPIIVMGHSDIYL